MILGDAPTRIGIYFFYDHDGVVDPYVEKFLEGMASSLTRLVVVCNGKLNEAGRKSFERLGANPLIVRANDGFDVWAYKAGIDYVGWDELSRYDELIMMNFTIMGPVGSFDPMYDEMARRDLDFWGITIHNGASFDPWGKMPHGVIPLHIQSHFIAVRRRMLSSPEFQTYWNDMGPIESYEDSIAKHEALFTPRFADIGFTWGVYVDTEDLVDEVYYPLFNLPVELITSRRSPIFKRKGFFSTPETYLDENSNRPARDLIDYLSRTADYDVDLVWQHIIRSANQYDMAMALNLYDIHSSQGPVASTASTVGVIVGVGSESDLVGRLGYLDSLPADATAIFFAHEDQLPAAALAAMLVPTRWAGSRVLSVPGKALTWSVLSAYKGELDGIDLICIIEPSGPRGVFPFSNATAATRQSLEGVLATKTYVSRIVESFEKRPRLGMLVPPRALHHDNFGSYGHEWGAAFLHVVDVMKTVGLTVPVDPAKTPVSAVSGAYWVRGQVLASELHHLVRASSLSPDDMNLIAPLVVQAMGFYPSYVAPEVVATNLITNATHMIRRANQRFGTGVGDTFAQFEARLSAGAFLSDGSTTNVTARLYFDSGSGFREIESIAAEPEQVLDASEIRFTYDVPLGAKDVRFDPLEQVGVIVGGITAVSQDGRKISLFPVNGIRRGTYDIFETYDPQYLPYSWPRDTTQLVVTMKSVSILRPPFTKRAGSGLWITTWRRARRAFGRIR